MNANYRTEAEWLAAFAALMTARNTVPAPLQHTKAIPITRPTGGLAHTKPVPLTRGSR